MAVLAADQSNPAPYTFLGNIAIQRQQVERALDYFEKAKQLQPNDPLYHTNYAGALMLAKRYEEALAASDKALALHPSDLKGLLISGNAFHALGKLQESVERLKKLLTLYPTHVPGLNALSEVLQRLHLFDIAQQLVQSALLIDPKDKHSLLNLGHCLRKQTRNQEAVLVYNKLLQLEPDNLEARILKCMTTLLPIYTSEEELEAVRSRYKLELAELRAFCSTADKEKLLQTASWVGAVQPFFLPYQGKNDRELQALYGDIVARLMQASYPEREKPLPKAPGKRIRVGIVTSSFRYHSVWKARLKGWLDQINPEEFTLFGYYTGETVDDCTEEAREKLEKLVLMPKTYGELVTAISEDHLDVLIYPEIGMDPLAMRLAALRLSPVQVTTWGHPETSGLHTIDYFLSSALMEPEDAVSHYTEKLILLPNLSVYYIPSPSTVEMRHRSDFGFKEEDVLFWCCQTFIKYLPAHDDVFAEIASRLPEARFVFLESIPELTHVFLNRLKAIFAKYGLSVEKHCYFLPRLEKEEFEQVTALMDVFLDTIGWSGFNSTLESLAHNLPIVTLPDATMRSRHTAAILTMMQMEDAIASSKEDYIRRAVELGSDLKKRIQMRGRLSVQKELLYRDKTAITSLENFLKEVSRY